MKPTNPLLLLAFACAVSGAEPLHLSVVIHGRAPLQAQMPESPTYGIVETATFAGDPILVTVSALHAMDDRPAGERFEWTLRTLEGAPVAVTPVLRGEAAGRGGLRATANRIDFDLGAVEPGRYLLTIAAKDPATGRVAASEAKMLSVYRGDENETVRRAFLRDRARRAVASGTREGYDTFRDLMRQAAENSSDPGIYEELGDASAPWIDPEETAVYYNRSLAVSKQNLEKKFGPRNRWPAVAAQIYSARERKVKAFESLLPFYKTNFDRVRVIVTRNGRSELFAIERRSDGSVVREVRP